MGSTRTTLGPTFQVFLTCSLYLVIVGVCGVFINAAIIGLYWTKKNVNSNKHKEKKNQLKVKLCFNFETKHTHKVPSTGYKLDNSAFSFSIYIKSHDLKMNNKVKKIKFLVWIFKIRPLAIKYKHKLLMAECGVVVVIFIDIC
jgi:hypothetical protein